MPIRVLHIIGSLRLGGAQVCLKQIVEHNDDPTIEHYIYPLRPHPVDIPIDGRILHRPYPHYDLRKFFAILRICRDQHIDIIHAHLHKPILGALLATFFCDVKVIVHEHGAIARPGLQYALYRRLLGALKNRAAQFIAVSNAAAEQLTRYAGIEPTRIQVIYNAVDTSCFSANIEARRRLRRELGLAPDTVVVGFLGRLSYVKGPDILLNAFERLIQTHPECVLVFLGDGEMNARLSAQAAQLGIARQVKFLGFKENAADYINIFDVACVPSRQESFGIAAVELMSTAIPVVVNPVDGLAEIVREHENALVPQTNTPEDLCACLVNLVENPDLRRSLAQGGPETARRFSVSRLVAAVNATYRQLVQSD